MIRANEAREKTLTLRESDEAKRKAELKVWVEENCGKAVSEAIQSRRFSTTVAVPSHIKPHEVANMVKVFGYHAHVSYGDVNELCITW